MKKYWFSTSSGRIEFELTLEQAQQGSHSGRCDEDIAQLLTDEAISSQLLAIIPQLIADELREYGAWNDEELANHADNLASLLWIACGDIVYQQFNNESEKMTLSEAIANKGLVESKEIKRVMSERRRAWNSTKNRKFPRYTGQSTADYVSAFLSQNCLKP